MPRCIFCLQEFPKLTDEHVFPAALGGNLVVENSVCAGCNNGFSKFEQSLAKELTPIRLLLRIPDRYGNVPPAAATAKTQQREYEARLKADGSVQLKPIVTVVDGKDGSKEIVYQYATAQQKEVLRQKAKEKGFQLIESISDVGEEAEIHVSGDLKFIGSQEGLRTVAKIAYTGLAFQAGVPIVLGDSFTQVRAYIKDGEGKPSARLFVHKGFLTACQQGPHQHSIVLAARRDKKRVDAIVRLFGGLPYFVNLSENYDGADFFNTLAYDAHRGEINKVLFAHEQAELLQTEDVATSKDTVWDDVVASGQWFCSFLDREIQSKLKREAEKR